MRSSCLHIFKSNHTQESTKQQGQIAKKPKTVPLQQADQELEEGLEQQFSKV